jgi:4-alpha-glucanotransferase
MTIGSAESRRWAGLLVPLFSCCSTRSWGVGEFGDLPGLADWMRGAGLRTLQLLPLNEMALGQRSPYSALSAMALDPIFITVPAVTEYAAMGGEDGLDTAMRDTVAHVRARPHVDYRAIRTLKNLALRQCFGRFLDTEWARDTPRALELRAFIREQAWWLDDYALFRAARHTLDGQDWRRWPAGIRRRDADSLADLRRESGTEILYRQYLQWIAHTQWCEARRSAHGVRVFGDFPFIGASDSADTWAKQQLFSFEGTVGAPPDAFSETGQNWKLPVYRWDVLRAQNYSWFQHRARRMADLFDGFRVDHVVGLFRTWVFPLDGRRPYFTPADEPSQLAQGEAVLRVIQQAGAEVVAEDLGTIPDFVRTALAALAIPGYKVLRWERRWQEASRPFITPTSFPPLSLATSGTHDTETLAEWWAELEASDRAEVLKACSPRPEQTMGPESSQSFVPRVRDRLLESLYASGSKLLVIPIQDVFGWTDRINVPAIVDDKNWTWKLPWPVDGFASQPEARERQQTLLRWALEYGRR